MNNANHDSGFFASQAAKLINRSPVEVSRLGQLITPDGPANGKGHRSLYSFRNLVEMVVAEEMIRFGVPQKKIQKYLRELRSSRGRWLESGTREDWIILDQLWRWGAGNTLDVAIRSLVNPEATAIVAINVGTIRESIKERIRRLWGGDAC